MNRIEQIIEEWSELQEVAMEAMANDISDETIKHEFPSLVDDIMKAKIREAIHRAFWGGYALSHNHLLEELNVRWRGHLKC